MNSKEKYCTGALRRVLFHIVLLGMLLNAVAAFSSENSGMDSDPPDVFVVPAPAAPASEKEGEPGVFARFGNRLVQVWDSSTYDLYIPAYTWHNRLMYDDNKIKSYNEHPWGAGVGKSVYDEDGDWHSLYAMGFMDSHDKFEPIVGYGFLKNWSPDDAGDWKLGAGYTIGITGRDEYNYIPIPLPLPMFGIGYKDVAVQGVYIPGLYNDGNVLFVWLKWQLTD